MLTIFARTRASPSTDGFSRGYNCLSTCFRFTDAVSAHPHSRCHNTLSIQGLIRLPSFVYHDFWWYPRRLTSHPSPNA